MKKFKSLVLAAGVVLMSLACISCPGGAGGGKSDPAETETVIKKEITQPDKKINCGDPSISWQYIGYDLSNFAGKEVTIDFSAQMIVNITGTTEEHLMWQVNCSGYPMIAEYTFQPGENNVTVTGKNATPIAISAGNQLYLSTNNAKREDMTIELKNVKYTVSYGAKAEEEELPAKEYPTDIFTVADEKIADFTADSVWDGSQAVGDITFNDDGTVTHILSAKYSGGGVVFYINKDKSVINVSNYDSIDVELVCSPVTGHWDPKAKAPSFGFRLYTPEATGFWSGFEDIEYFGFDGDQEYGTITKTIDIKKEWVNNYKDSCDNDDIMGFAFKFNAYQTGNNENNDQLKVQIKKVQFNKKPGTPADQRTDDGLTDADRGTVQRISYPSHDYSTGDTTGYNKPAWVYLPAGYDPESDEEYPLFILMHGFGQNQDTWGLTNIGTGGKIKGYMDRGMFSGNVEKFILVVPTGVANESYANGTGNDFGGYNVFGGELRNDLIPYMRANYKIKEGRDNVAMAGLSMGGGQTFNIGIGECLDLISYFGAFSAATFGSASDYVKMVDEKPEFEGLKIHQLYMINGDADATISMDSFNSYVEAMEAWDRVEKFDSEVYPGGTHDFPVWYRGFKHLIPLLFK